MFGTTSFQEMLVMGAIIGLLSMTGLWKHISRGLREMRGEHVEDEPPRPIQTNDLCYRMLGVSTSAPWDEVERAYRQKAKIHHPDHGGDDDTMRALNEAYQQIKRQRGK